MSNSSWGKNKYTGGDVRTGVDAGYGLIFRLNFLWWNADKKALDGDFDSWNYTLDRIYCNLTYRYPIEVLEDDNGNIVTVKLPEKDEKIYKKITEEITKIKIAKNIAIKKKDRAEYNALHQKHYDALQLKDIWLRKYMQELGLYLKEYEKNPANALFGGG